MQARPAEDLAGEKDCRPSTGTYRLDDVRIIPAGKEGEYVEFGGLLGGSYVMPLNKFSSAGFVRRGGRIPAPIQSFRN